MKRVSRWLPLVALAALLGGSMPTLACFAPPQPASDAELRAASGDTLAFKGVIMKVLLPDNFVGGVFHDPLDLEIRPVTIFRGTPGASITIHYHACAYVPGDVGAVVNVLAARSSSSGRFESLR
jgi:hypothetical protein